MHSTRRRSLSLCVAFSALTAMSLVGCQKQAATAEDSVSDANLVSNSQLNVVKEIGQGDYRFTVYSSDAFRARLGGAALDAANSSVAAAMLNPQSLDSGMPTQPSQPRRQRRAEEPSTPSPQQSLLLGYPLALVGQKSMFGAVITKVSDRESEKLGGLKLTDLTAIHVKTSVARDAQGNYGLVFSGCLEKCTDSASDKLENIVAFPIVGVDRAKQEAIIDLSVVGRNLDLMKILDPKGEYLKLRTVSTNATTFDFSNNTLVFDIETHMVPVPGKSNAATTTAVRAADAGVTFTTRWFLQPSSVFNPNFVARSPANGVGFFTTKRGNTTRINRFAALEQGARPVKYYIKNVPAEYQHAFASAFDEWNEKFRAVIGRNLLDYEFIPAGDPRNQLLVAGDIRYNILEWDLVNSASYGGLGPSVANEVTGQTLSANVLIQGPKIVEIYTKWFDRNQLIAQHRANGDDESAERLEVQLRRELKQAIQSLEGPRFELTLGGKLAFRVNSQQPELQDPLMQREDFDEVPEGYTYQQYMDGYFHDMVAHELGHNLGLRHNFRGNLGAADEKAQGKVSRSVMEYLNRNFRHLDLIGPYDVMAITYGYTGRAPQHTDWFCTDEDKPSEENLDKSAECSSDDATNDPFGYLQQRLQKAVDKIVARGSRSAPEWKVEDMERELEVAVKGLAVYAATAQATSSQWTNFAKSGRPSTPARIKQFAVESILDAICSPALADEIQRKQSQEAQEATARNILALHAKVAELVAPYNIGTEAQFRCQ